MAEQVPRPQPPPEDSTTQADDVTDLTVARWDLFRAWSPIALVLAVLVTLVDDEVLCVPAGLRHNIRNTGRTPLKLYTIYSPPNHPEGTLHRTKAEAEMAEAAHV